MAATGFTPVSLYYSATASNVPLAANLVAGELAMNTNDGKLFYKDSSGVVQTMASKATGSIGGSTTQVQFNNAGVLGGSASLTWSGTVLTSSGFAGPLNGTVGATTANTGAFTTLTASSSITNSSLTTGRIVYTTTGGLETSSANLLYSGTDLTVYGITVGRGGGALSTNTAVGAGALAATNTGGQSVAVGTNALAIQTSGLDNVAIGVDSLAQTTTATNNSAIGTRSLWSNTTGSQNTGLGRNALRLNTTGSNNTAQGVDALLSNTTASNNTAVGYQAGYTNATGTYSTYLGYQSGYSITGTNNTFGGAFSGANLTTGTYNTGWGHGTINNSTASTGSGSYNSALGYEALNYLSTGSNNAAVGYQALARNTTASNNVAVGYQALYTNTTGSVNTAVGRLALANNTTASNNSAFGEGALFLNTTGASNVAIGLGALGANTTASSNTAVGYQAMYSNTTASYGTAVGYQSLYSSTGLGNNAFGYRVLYSNTTGFANCGFGSTDGSINQTLVSNTTGSYNSAFGTGALGANTTGSYNTAYGASALLSNTTASYNTAVGYQAGYSAVTADYNTFIGYYAGRSTTGDQNTFIGKFAGNAVTSGTLNTIIGAYNGNQGGLDIRTASNYIVLSDGGGTPRQVINSSGYVGIQNTAPAAPLHVGPLNGSGSLNGYTKLAVEAQDYAVVTLKSPAANFSQIIFTDPTTTLLGGINYYNSSNATPNAMAFNVNNSERMRIDSSGNVGIGTSSPRAKFEVNGIGSFGDGTAAAPTITFGNELTVGLFRANNATLGFSTGGSERMRIDSSGNLLVGTTATNPVGSRVNGLALLNNGAVRARAALSGDSYFGLSVTSGVNLYFYTDNGSAFVTGGNIATNGATTAYNATSDYRLKNNVQPLTSALSRVSQLRPVTWTWKEGYGGTQPNCEGFIAHELHEILPIAVTGEKDAVDADGNPQYQGIDTSFLVATLTAAIQEQQALIQDLTTRLAKLEAK